MSLRTLQVAGLLILMVAFGAGVYLLLGALRHSGGGVENAQAPDKSRPLINLPGSIVLAQAGSLYRLQNDAFTVIASGGWTQPAVLPDHQHLLAVKRTANSSDIYLLGLDGSIQTQLTTDARKDVPSNHWSFYPHPTNDGQSVFYSFDPKYTPNTFTVNLSTYSMSLQGNQARARRWTYPAATNGAPIGTGGDLQPQPLSNGGLIETRYQEGANSQMYGEIWLQSQPARGSYLEPGHSLTPDTESCYSPTLSPDGSQLAMVCNDVGASNSRLMSASFDGDKLGPLKTVAQGPLNSPTWSPDGKSLLYLAPSGDRGYFQLFELPLNAGGSNSSSPSPGQPRQVTHENNFDATSAPVWF